ncbi:MAG: hypothetical protein HQ474_09525 [Flammeovirgaceae bacterium]|jgi:hypothetical protein|nr:hypothetical protein [Flammeovirgaceae bacterium]|tara:strand:+ start:5019 stop:5327 length:309 start_codon:yes stop_codon:yes gene_type:complete
MKSLNENWFLITLTSVVFGLLGYLLGPQNNHKGPSVMRGPHGPITGQQINGSDGFIFESRDAMMFGEDGLIKIDIDSIHVELDTLLSGVEPRVKVMVKNEIK